MKEFHFPNNGVRVVYHTYANGSPNEQEMMLQEKIVCSWPNGYQESGTKNRNNAINDDHRNPPATQAFME